MYTCTRCHKEVDTKKSYHDTNGNLICRSCQLTELRIQRYGSLENYRKHMTNAQKKSCLEKYGVENAFQNEEVKKKIKRTNLERYGNEYAIRSESVQKKAKATLMNNFGVEHTFQSKEIQQKTRDTMLERYGVDNAQKVEEFKSKTAQTNLERYGNTCTLASKPIRDRIIPKWIEKYGTPYPLHSPLIKDKETASRKLTYRNYRDKVLPRRIQTVVNSGYTYISQRVREDGETVVTYNCPSCHQNFDWCLADDNRHAWCKSCGQLHGSSIGERSLKEFIREILHDDMIDHNRTILGSKQELDIYVPEFNIAFEYDGLYWHNDKPSDKFELARQKGIRLIQINESEWLNENHKIKSFIKSTFGIFDKRIFARKCKTVKISNSVYKDFLEENHLQGYAPAKIRYGLYFENELIQVMSFNESELIRECSKLGHSIIGGKDKLFSHFIREFAPKTIITHCEKNKFSGKSYLRLGFKLDHESLPQRSYYNKNPKLTRIPNQQEENECFTLYDYGSYVFVWKA